MIKVECYKCEICHEIYSEEDTTLTCEKSHRADDELRIVESKHKVGLSENGFPEQIIVDIKNYSGVAAIYRIVREDSVEGIYEEWEDR